MFQSLVPVTQQRHASARIKPIDGFSFAQGYHLASVMVHEFVRAASLYPIVFVEDKERDSFRPVALLGLDSGRNLFVDGDSGRWEGSYIPAIIRRYPFALASTGEQDQYTVCLDEGSHLLSYDTGTPLFNDDGSPTEVLENVKRYLGELQKMEQFTEAFCRYLQERNMFTPLNMRVRDADQQAKTISGCYVINEERLNSLSDERFLEMRHNRYLHPIYAHLGSLAQIERLVMLKEGRMGVRSPEATPDPMGSDAATGDSGASAGGGTQSAGLAEESATVH